MKDSKALDKRPEVLERLRKLGWITENGQQAQLPKTAYFPQENTFTKTPRFDKDTMANNRAFKRT